MDKYKDISRSLSERVGLIKNLRVADILDIYYVLRNCVLRDGTIYVCGNGGSYAQACHFAAELSIRFKNSNESSKSVVVLGSNGSSVTACGNDFGFKYIFSRELEGVGSDTDCLVCFSTSGTSPNILEACGVAKDKGMDIIGITGSRDSKLGKLSDRSIGVLPGGETCYIQELHLIVLHILADLVQDIGRKE